jgi:sugar lactone lactonase YvrE
VQRPSLLTRARVKRSRKTNDRFRGTPVKRILLALLAVAVVAAGGTTASAHRGHDHGGKGKERLFTLTPDPAANPEGIEFDKRNRAFYVSITGDGSIYRGTLGSDKVEPFIAGGEGKAAVGLEKHRGKLYVAGGPTGAITVYDLKTKQAVATFQTGTGGFLNDLVVTKRGDVYVTDSIRPTLWHVTAEQVAAGSGTPQALDVSGGIPFTENEFNLNGIVAKGSHRLVVVNSFSGQLFRIDLNRAGDAIDAIDEIEGVTLKGGDGMILDRGRLVVVTGDPAQLNFVKLRSGASRAELQGTQTSTLLKGPSTVARAKNLYLVVNADFATSTKPFTVAGLPARGRHDDRGDDHKRGDDDRGDDHGDDDDHGGHGRGDDDDGNGGSGRH